MRYSRQASHGSQRSRRSASEPEGIEEGREARELGAAGGDVEEEEEEERLETPEVCMTEQGPDPTKSPTNQPRKVVMPKMRFVLKALVSLS